MPNANTAFTLKCKVLLFLSYWKMEPSNTTATNDFWKYHNSNSLYAQFDQNKLKVSLYFARRKRNDAGPSLWKNKKNKNANATQAVCSRCLFLPPQFTAGINMCWQTTSGSQDSIIYHWLNSGALNREPRFIRLTQLIFMQAYFTTLHEWHAPAATQVNTALCSVMVI